MVTGDRKFCLSLFSGNHILTEEDLYDFYKELLARASQDAGKTIKVKASFTIISLK